MYISAPLKLLVDESHSPTYAEGYAGMSILDLRVLLNVRPNAPIGPPPGQI